jgi:hypothetical protein
VTLDERINFFDKHYNIIANYHLDKGEKIYVGNNDKGCRFCGKKEPDVTFKNVSHAVPEFLGNKQLICRNECDACNTFVSHNLEHHLDHYTKPYRTIAHIKGKKKIPLCVAKDQCSKYEANLRTGNRIISRVDSNFSSIDLENNEIKTNFNIGTYIPTAVYKCLVKIALSVIPDKELEFFENSLLWIMDSNHPKKFCEPQILLKTFIPGNKPNNGNLTIFVLRTKVECPVLPCCIFVMCFGNMVYQILVPSDVDILVAEQGTQAVSLVRFPLPFEKDWEFGSLEYSQDDMTSHELVKNRVIPITHGFDKAFRVDPNSITL